MYFFSDTFPDGAVRNVSFNATAQKTGYYFRCNNSEYISRTLWCDGRTDCTDGSDERSCDVSCPSRFRCDNGRCLAFTLLCDYRDDCGDQSDERQCASMACRADEWMCASGQCIPRSDRCDLNTQCQDGSDEDMCDVCPEPAFQCYDRLCIHEANVCDGHIDCGGVYNEDEGTSCRIRAHPSCGAWHALGARDNGAYTLTDGDGGTFPVECIFDHSRDRVATVIHHDQEDVVVMDTISAARHHINYNIAMDSVMYVLQGSQSCSQRVDVDCQYVYRAMSNSISWLDVKGGRHLFHNSSKPNCSCELEYACDMGQERCFCDVIVQQAWNMLPDTTRLHDHGDIVDKQFLPISGINISVVNEYGSIRFTVGPLVCVEEKHNATTQMMCKSGITADVATRCVLDYNQHGGVVGCRDLTHLLGCGDFVCPVNYMKCPDSFCLPLRRVCDGHRDCLDGRDEQQCDSWVCPNLFRCGDGGTCLTWDQVCDGREHCPRGDDERDCDPTCPEGCTCQDMATRCQHLSLDVASAIPNDTKNLDLSRINIPDFENYSFNGLDSLLYLNLSDCGILDLTNTSFVDLISLMYLDLSNNLITSLVENVFFGVRNLKHLILSGNKMLSYISPGAFNGLWNLPVLDLSGLSVANLQENAFSGLTNLKRLNLSNTGLVAVETGAFSELDNLISLDLRTNTIKSFDGGVFSGLTGLQDLVTDAYEFCCIRPISVTQAKCLPPPDEFSSCSDLMKNVTLRISLWVLGAVALLGNSIVLFYRLIYDRAGLKRNNGIYVANLGVSDFLMGVYMFIIAGADTHFRGWYNWNDTWWRESELCQLAGFLSTLSSEVSTIFLCIITIDRLVALKSPFSAFAQNSKLACVVCVVTWLCGLALAGVPLLPLEYFRGRFYSRSGVCLALPLTRDKPPGWEYATAVFVVFNFLCFVVIAVGQAGIYRDIRGRPEVTVQKGDVQLARKLSLIVMSDFLCWFPICVMGLMAMRGHVIPGEVYTWTAAFILPINSALNPLLYTLSSATSTNLRRKIVRGVLGSGRSNPLSSANDSTRISESRGISRRRHRGRQPSHADAVKTPDGAVSLRTAILAGLDVTEMLYICQGVTRSLEVMHSHHLACTSLSEDSVIIFYKQGMMTQVGISDEMTPIKDGYNPSHDVQQLGHMVQLMLTMGKRNIQ
ncbi:G-protein coupled receptor GRL101-like [Haliotis cracherodii]|uniref:G-protein coupled receptor GRL101-like n=1 Tax=Haliotis cracherodii TaxID=6455 RepID=UPI0039E9964B